jgi:hypothetical protein
MVRLISVEVVGVTLVVLLIYIPAVVKVMIRPLEADITWIKRLMNGRSKE